MCQWPTSIFETSYGCTALDMPQWREMTEQIDWRAKQLSQVTCVSEDLKCCGASDTTCGHKAKDITPSNAWRREAWKQKALEDLPRKDERGLSSVRPTLEPPQRQRWENCYHEEDRIVSSTAGREARHAPKASRPRPSNPGKRYLYAEGTVNISPRRKWVAERRREASVSSMRDFSEVLRGYVRLAGPTCKCNAWAWWSPGQTEGLFTE